MLQNKNLKSSNQVKRGVFCLAVGATLYQTVNADIEFYTLGIGYRNRTQWVGFDNISMMGGVPIYIKASGGLDMNAALNTVGLVSKNIPQAQFIQPRISDDDAFNSNTAAGLLGWTIPSVMDIFSTPQKQYTYYDFYNDPSIGLPGAYTSPTGGTDYIVFDVSFASIEASPPCYTHFTSCHISYNQRFTPQLYDTMPNQVYAGQTVTFMLNPGQIFSKLPTDWEPFYYLKIGKELTNWEGLIDVKFRLANNQIQSVPTVINNRPSKSQDPDINFSMFGRTFIRQSHKHCNWAGDDCWTIRIHPKIDGISASQGFLDGGQIMQINGFGLIGQKISVLIDGVDCNVNQNLSTDTALVCETGPKATLSTTNISQPGNYGITHSYVNPSDKKAYVNWNTIVDGTYPPVVSLSTTLEMQRNIYDSQSGNHWDGWFFAPETGNYKFYLSADDQMKIFMDTANPYDPLKPYTFTTSSFYQSKNNVAYSWYSTGWRQYHRLPLTQSDPWGKQQSDWLALSGGKYYRFQAQHIDWGGTNWMSTAVEFQKANPNGHPNTTKAVQNLRIEQTPSIAEKWTLTIDKPSSGQFQLQLQSPKKATLWKSGAFSCNMEGSQFGGVIAAFFQDCATICGNVQVDLAKYDSSGAVTSDNTKATKYVYTVTLMKRISGFSFTSYNIVPFGSITSIVTVMPPYGPSGIPSSAPLSGQFVIKCPDTNGKIFQTRPQAINRNLQDIQADFEEDIGWLRGRVQLNDVPLGSINDNFKFNYRDNGVNIFLIFDGLNSNPPQCQIVSDTTNPIVGATPSFIGEVTRPFGQGIMFEPVGLDFLYTDAMSPQVLVNIDGLPALCPNFNCDYAYVASTSQITAQDYNSGSMILTITGTLLPTSNVKLSFGGALCALSPLPTYSETQIQCTLANAPRAGSHKAEVRVSNGLLPYASGVADIPIPLTLTSVSPTTVNPLGGAILTIVGSGFPIDLNQITVKFSDNTQCSLQSLTSTQIICKVDGFSNSDGLARTIIVTVQNIRYEQRRRELYTTVPTSNQSLILNVNTSLPKVTSIDKTNVSPVLKQTLTFQLSSEYTDTLIASNLLVKVLNKGANYSRELYVMSVDDSKKTFTVKFNGAPVGTYTFQVTANSSSQYGLLDTSAVTLQTSSTVTNITPLTGSVFGGTILTITGTNFSTKISDQAVTVGDKNTYCDILTATTTQLTCRIRQTGLDATATSSDNLVLVILAASSEAECPGKNCNFTFATPLVTMTSLSQAFNPATNSLQITAIGTGFPAGNIDGIKLYLNGNLQTTTSVDSSTSLTFTVTNISDFTINSISVLFADGFALGDGTTAPFVATPFNLSPSFVSISPNSGSIGGTLLTVNAPGIGKDTLALDLYDTTTSKNLCQKVTVTGSGTFTCLTNQLAVASTDTINLVQGKNQLACANTDPTKCQFSQILSSSPQITSATISGNVITFSGTLFPSANDFTAQANFKSQIVSITGWTDSSATATFLNGIPASLQSENAVPQLQFIRNVDNVILVAYSTGITLTNVVTVASSDSTSGISVSFAGGLSYTITKDNIYATLLEIGNSVNVCGNVCQLDQTQSNLNQAVCTLPALATTYSANTYQIVQAGVLKGTWTGSVQAQVANVLDGNYPSEFTDPNSNCYIQLSFPDTQVGVLDSVKILINTLPNDKKPFINTLKLQGFDGTKYTDLWLIDGTIHEGWNTMTWAAGSKPAYQKYKWTGTTIGSCRIGEIVFTGIVANQDNQTSTICTPKLIVGSSSTDLSPVTYTAAKTPTITKITPRYGKVSGSETITISGTNFVSGSTHVTIDGIVCTIVSVTSTQIQCTTGKRLGDQPNPTFIVQVDNSGLTATQGNTFTYVQYWSEPSTWGNDAPPQYGEAVEIPKGRNLLVDVDSVPQLSFLLVQGSLIFSPHSDPNHLRTFDAGYIFIQGGYMEVGTEAFPYTSKITITMHGDVTTPALPTYGNKSIAVRTGTLSLVGKERKVTWTMLDKTANAQDTKITLMSQTQGYFDWQVGEQIVIASTSYAHNQAEVRTITAVSTDSADSTKPLLTLDSPLLYKHYAATETYGTDTIDMRAEVGLLTRNVKYRGDPETSAKNKYGAHIMLHSPGDESSIGRILYVELTDVGQAYKLGRYPIHFHLIGTVAKSLVKGNSIHQTYNRAVTIHAVSYFNIVQNVIYNTMGHSIFIEDAIEEHNVIDGNLVIGTNRSWSLLNSDQTPSSFWITNPNNIIINNHAAGSDRYGYWYDTKPNPMGPSFTTSICPENTRLGEFRDNVAHSNGRYGLRIFHKLIPRTRPCDPLVFDDSNPSAAGSPYTSNPVIPAIFYNLVSWKNVENGAIAEQTGAVQWKNFKVADNLLVGLEWSLIDPSIKADGFCVIDGALVIGKSQNTETALDQSTPTGIITARKEYFTVQNVKFYNFNFANGSSAFGDCSHCFFADSTDSGARTVTVKGLSFDSTITKKITYQMPWRGIFLDADGSLTGLGAGSWAIAYFPHNDQPECSKNLEVYSGQICDNTIQVRRIVFWDPNPGTFMGMLLRIAKYDDSVMSALSPADLKAYQKNLDNYSQAYQTILEDPQSSWALPYVTGHKYRIFWDIGQLDILSMKMEISSRWKPTDKPVLFNLPYVDKREDIDFFGKYGSTYASNSKSSFFYPNGSLTNNPQTSWLTGYNYNDNLVNNELNFVVTGNVNSSKTIQINGVRCRENLVPWCNPNPTVQTCTGTQKLWSDPTAWVTAINPAGGVPKAGDNIIIPTGTIFLFDLASSPIYNLITIDGCLSFLTDNSIDQTLSAYQIYVHTGKFTIGSSTAPYTKKATIILYGDFDSAVTVMDGATEAGNKLIANNGEVRFYGKNRSRMSRLTAEAQKGATTVYVASGLDWVAGELLGFAPTAMQWTQSETAIIKSYNSATGALVLTSPLQYYHFGAAASTGPNYQGLDMRGEVILLTRNIVIQGDSTLNNWGGQFVTSDATQIDSTGTSQTLSGLTILNNVEMFNMGQMNTDKAALRFENSSRAATGTELSTITNCVVHDSYAWAIKVKFSSNINMSNCDVFTAKQVGVVLDIVTNIHMDSVNVYNVIRRLSNDPQVADKECCVAFCSWSQYMPCYTSSWTNSIIAGCPFAGIIGFGYSCKDPVGGSTTNVIKNVVIHSVLGSGASILPDPAVSGSSQCYQASHITAYKNTQGGIGTMYPTMDLKVSNILLVDNQLGITLNTVTESDNEKLIELSNSFIYGETADLAKDCPDGTTGTTGADCYCPNKYGLMSFYSLQKGKDAHIEEMAARPVYNTKAFAVWNPKAVLTNINFINFATRTSCNARQSAIGLNPLAPDYFPIHYFTGTKFTNVQQDAIAYLVDPPLYWASINDCGEWPCTGPSNSLFNFYNSVFEVTDGVTTLPTYWTTGTTKSYNFQIVGKVSLAGSSYPNCQLNSQMNAFFCADPQQVLPFQVGLLEFESLDGDTLTRSVQPVVITGPNGYSNTLNSFMDHGWDGFYTSQKRLSRFIAQVLTGQAYTITYTGTPPKSMRYILRSDTGTSGVTIKVPYPNAGSYSVSVSGNIVQPNGWDATTHMPLLIDPKTAVCGTNRFVGVQNYLEFYLVPNCLVVINPRDAILTSVRLQWTADQFFNGDGVTTFCQRMAAVLGVDASRVKVVSVYEGSLNVNVQIQSDPTTIVTNSDGSVQPSSVALADLTTLSATLIAVVQPGSVALGAPVLEIQASVQTNVIINTIITATTISPGAAVSNIAFGLTTILAILLALIF